MYCQMTDEDLGQAFEVIKERIEFFPSNASTEVGPVVEL